MWGLTRSRHEERPLTDFQARDRGRLAGRPRELPWTRSEGRNQLTGRWLWRGSPLLQSLPSGPGSVMGSDSSTLCPSAAALHPAPCTPLLGPRDGGQARTRCQLKRVAGRTGPEASGACGLGSTHGCEFPRPLSPRPVKWEGTHLAKRSVRCGVPGGCAPRPGPPATPCPPRVALLDTVLWPEGHRGAPGSTQTRGRGRPRRGPGALQERGCDPPAPRASPAWSRPSPSVKALPASLRR